MSTGSYNDAASSGGQNRYHSSISSKSYDDNVDSDNDTDDDIDMEEDLIGGMSYYDLAAKAAIISPPLSPTPPQPKMVSKDVSPSTTQTTKTTSSNNVSPSTTQTQATSSNTNDALSYKEGQQVVYKNSQGSKSAIIKKIHLDDELQPYYTIEVDGREKQTDDAHLSINAVEELDKEKDESKSTTQMLPETPISPQNPFTTKMKEELDVDTAHLSLPYSTDTQQAVNDSMETQQIIDNTLEELDMSDYGQQEKEKKPQHKANQEYYDILEMAENRLRQDNSSIARGEEDYERRTSSNSDEEAVLGLVSNCSSDDNSSGDEAVRKRKKKRKKSKKGRRRKSNASSSQLSIENESQVDGKRRSAVFTSLFPTDKLVHHSIKKPFETSINADDLKKIGYKDDPNETLSGYRDEYADKDYDFDDPNDDLPHSPGRGRTTGGRPSKLSSWNPANLVTAAQSKLSDSKVDSNGFYSNIKVLMSGGTHEEEIPVDYNLHNIGKPDSNKKKKRKKKEYTNANEWRRSSIDWGDEGGSVLTGLSDLRRSKESTTYHDKVEDYIGDVEMEANDDCSFDDLNEINETYIMNEKLVQRLIWQKTRRRIVIFACVVVVFFSVCIGIYVSDKDESSNTTLAPPILITNDESIDRNEPPPRPNVPPPIEPVWGKDEAKPHTMDLTDLQYIINTITPDQSVFKSSHTPQSKALEWSKNDMKIYNVGVKSRVAQRYVLATLYYATNGTAWKTNTNWGDGHECEWHGVGCENGENDAVSVTYLDLNSNHLVGSIPQEIGYINSLEQIHLWGNNLASSIPSTISKLGKLHTLYLDKNYLSGELSDVFDQLKSLKHLDVSENRFRGHIPHGLGSLTNLRDLRLSNNLLTGTLPVSLISLSNLQTLLLDSNSLSGSLPNLLGEMKSLITIRVHENDFKGQLPSFADAQILEEAHFDGNYFSGTIPEFGSSRLRELYLGQNALTGSIPDIGNLVSLEIFSASSNKLNSTIPAAIATVDTLNILDLSHNKLTGEIPSEVSGLMLLHELRLDHNRLQGFLPDWIGNLKHLRIVHLNNNLLDGELKLPINVGDLDDLTEFAIHNNDITGVVSEDLCDLLLDVLTSDCWGSKPRVDCPCCTECF